EHDAFTHSNVEATAQQVAERVRQGNYRVVVLSASAQGRDLAPRVAAKLQVPIAAEVIAFELDGDALIARHFTYAGKVIATLRLTATPAVVSVRPGAVQPEQSPREGRVESLALVGDPAASRVVVTETIRGDSRRLGRA